MKNFKTIPSFPDYKLNINGQVYSTKTKRILKPNRKPEGYVWYSLRKNRKAHTVYLSRILVETFCPERFDPSLLVRHLNDIPSDNSLENLKCGTPKDNRDDAIRNGKKPWGTRLTEEQVREVKRLHKDGLSVGEIDIKTFIPRNHVARILDGSIWGHIKV